MLDFHTHILPHMDDGADDVDTSVAMLEQAYESGTELVVLTSHFYPREEKDLDVFLQRRKHRYDQLVKACEGKMVPRLLLGAEANVRTMFSSYERIRELCIEGTDYMLVEMPHDHWEEWMIECVYNLTLKGIKPIIAHIDRYMHFPKQLLNQLHEINPVYQINSDALRTYRGRKNVLRLFKLGRVHILGSDMHGIVKRKNSLPQAYEKLRTRYGKEYVRFIETNGENVLGNKPVAGHYNFPKVNIIRLFF